MNTTPFASSINKPAPAIATERISYMVMASPPFFVTRISPVKDWRQSTLSWVLLNSIITINPQLAKNKFSFIGCLSSLLPFGDKYGIMFLITLTAFLAQLTEKTLGFGVQTFKTYIQKGQNHGIHT